MPKQWHQGPGRGCPDPSPPSRGWRTRPWLGLQGTRALEPSEPGDPHTVISRPLGWPVFFQPGLALGKKLIVT